MAREHARKFHFLREIASGGFGSVYLAKVQQVDGFSRLVAIKLLHRRWSENKEITTRMRDEARLLGWLRHRNIVDVIELTSIDRRAAVIMEYLEAVDLKTVVQTLDERGERMSTYAALEATAFVASALDAAYNRPPFEGQKPLRVIHRDIKPSNIMVDESGMVKVLDFGVARGEFENRESHTSELQFGSVEYMPPERLFFEPETDRADIYSLGATLFECVAGERLGKAKGRAEKHATFLTDRMSFLAARCPLPNPQGADLAKLIQDMCAYNADNRPRAEEVVPRARALARQMPGPALTEWAETVVKPMVAEAARAPREPNPLTDSVLTEDSTLFSESEAEAALSELRERDPAPAAAAAEPPPERVPPALEIAPVAAAPLPAGDSPAPVDVPREDQRWEALRRAALAEMESAAIAALAVGPNGAAVDDEFGDEPTRIGGQLPPAMASVTTAPPPAGVISAPMPRALPASKKAAQPKPAAATFDPGEAATVRPEDFAAAVAPAESAAIPEKPTPAAPTLAPMPSPFAAPGLEFVAPVDDLPGAGLGAHLTMVPADDDEADPTVQLKPIAIGTGRPATDEVVGAPEPASVARTAPPKLEAPPVRPAAAPAPKSPVATPAIPKPALRSSGPSPAAQRTAPPAPSFADEPEPSSGGRGLVMLAVGVVAMGVLGGLLLGGGFVAYRYYLASQMGVPAEAPLLAPVPSASPPDGPAAVPRTPASAPAAPANPAVAAGPADNVFASMAADTRRMTVTCGEKEYSGEAEVVVPGPTTGGCRITLVKKDRSRLVAEVASASPGRYACFADNAAACTK